MVTLQAAGITTSSYSADTALEEDNTDRFEYDEEPGNSITFVDSPTVPTVESDKPLLFLYDCETTGESHSQDHIMEVGSVLFSDSRWGIYHQH